MKVFSLLFPAFFLFTAACAQPDSAKVIVYIVHGSKPGTANEYKAIGGYYGGHVVVQLDTFVYGFNYRSRKIHLFSSRRKNKGVFEKEGVSEWKSDKKKFKITTIVFPVSYAQFMQLQKEYEERVAASPYDYAFFGMRCASSCYDMLSLGGLVKPSSHGHSIRTAFHPKALRKKLEKIANEKHYKIIVQPGSKTRKWEGDK